MIAFILDHSETKVLLVDREYHQRRHRGAGASPRSSRWWSISTTRSATTAPRSATRPTRSSSPTGDADYAWDYPGRRMERDLAQLHVGHDRQSQGRRSTAIAAPRCRPTATPRNGRWACIRSISGPCRCSIATAGASRGPWRWSPAPRSACAAPAPRRSSTRWPTRRHAHVRRADHHAVHHRRHARGAPAADAQGRVHDRGRAAARRGARGAGEGELPRHPRLWPDRGLWPGDDLLVARGMGCADRRTNARG